MKTMEDITEANLQEQLRRMQTEREDFYKQLKKVQQMREEDHFKAGRRYRMLEDMRGKFTRQDGRILNLIDNAQSLLQSIHKQKIEVDENVENLIRKKQREWDIKEEDCYRQIQQLQEAQDEKEQKEE